MTLLVVLLRMGRLGGATGGEKYMQAKFGGRQTLSTLAEAGRRRDAVIVVQADDCCVMSVRRDPCWCRLLSESNHRTEKA